MIEIIKSLPMPVIIVISVLAYIIIGIIFTFLLGLVTHDKDFATVGMLWIVGLLILLVIGLMWLFDITYRKANEVSLRHRKKHRRR